MPPISPGTRCTCDTRSWCSGLPPAGMDGAPGGRARSPRWHITNGGRVADAWTEWAIFEVWDWFSDVGASLRDWDRRRVALEALAISRLPPDAGAELVLPRVGGCWVARATVRNRKLVSEHRHVFRARFSGSSRLWLEALTGSRPMPADAALLWVRVDGSALLPSRLPRRSPDDSFDIPRRNGDGAAKPLEIPRRPSAGHGTRVRRAPHQNPPDRISCASAHRFDRLGP